MTTVVLIFAQLSRRQTSEHREVIMTAKQPGKWKRKGSMRTTRRCAFVEMTHDGPTTSNTALLPSRLIQDVTDTEKKIIIRVKRWRKGVTHGREKKKRKKTVNRQVLAYGHGVLLMRRHTRKAYRAIVKNSTARGAPHGPQDISASFEHFSLCT